MNLHFRYGLTKMNTERQLCHGIPLIHTGSAVFYFPGQKTGKPDPGHPDRRECILVAPECILVTGVLCF